MKASVHNLGCKTNQYEADAMERLLKEAGYEIVPFSKDTPADVYVLNTCSVTNIASRKSRQFIHKARGLNGKAVVVAAGCFIQENADNIDIFLTDGAVDIVIGTDKKSYLIEAIDNFIKTGEKQCFIKEIKSGADYDNFTSEHVSERTRAYIKIQDGCNRHCTYCIIPSVRGPSRSRDLADIKNEAEGLVGNGIAEIVLTGIDMSAYGRDLKKGEAVDLSDVINQICKIPGLKRLRVSSLDPYIVTESFLEKTHKNKAFCPHFHLSLQSGSDNVLRKMRRGYTAEDFKEKCALIRKYFDNPAITSDIIVGFPGEDEKDFADTLKLAEDVGFLRIHIFKFSPKKGTPAEKMKEQVNPQKKTERSEALSRLAKTLSDNYISNMIGKKDQILIEEPAFENKFYTGYTKRYIKCYIPLSEDLRPGDEVEVEIIKNAGNGEAFAKAVVGK